MTNSLFYGTSFLSYGKDLAPVGRQRRTTAVGVKRESQSYLLGRMYKHTLLKRRLGGFQQMETVNDDSQRGRRVNERAQEAVFACRFCKQFFVDSTYRAHLVLRGEKKRCPKWEVDPYGVY